MRFRRPPRRGRRRAARRPAGGARARAPPPAASSDLTGTARKVRAALQDTVRIERLARTFARSATPAAARLILGSRWVNSAWATWLRRSGRRPRPPRTSCDPARPRPGARAARGQEPALCPERGRASACARARVCHAWRETPGPGPGGRHRLPARLAEARCLKALVITLREGVEAALVLGIAVTLLRGAGSSGSPRRCWAAPRTPRSSLRPASRGSPPGNDLERGAGRGWRPLHIRPGAVPWLRLTDGRRRRPRPAPRSRSCGWRATRCRRRGRARVRRRQQRGGEPLEPAPAQQRDGDPSTSAASTPLAQRDDERLKHRASASPRRESMPTTGAWPRSRRHAWQTRGEHRPKPASFRA